jgi:hypothetical protein
VKSVDYVKARLNKRKEPSFYEIIMHLRFGGDIFKHYTKVAIKRKLDKAVKAGYLIEEGGWAYKLEDKAMEFFTRKQV